MIDELISELPQKALLLASAFWPGPLTMVLKKSANVPEVVSCGLDSVGIRMPASPIAREIISQSGCPLAAPSANISGSVSPTTAEHCMSDLNGKIDAIVDGGKCDVGLESTVISLLGDTPIILRPGFITQDDIERVIGTTQMHSTAENDLKQGQTAASPGMKYKHYSPKAKVFVLNGTTAQYINYVNQNDGFALCFDEDVDGLNVPYISLGSEKNQAEQATQLFSALRELDNMGATTIFAHCPSKNGIGLAIYNRLLRAAAFNIINL
jgi:L-threonylcarbamoyladenylate synthase